MWTISSAFKTATQDPVQQVRVRLEILDTDFTPVHVIGGGGPDKAMIDGVVDVDVTRGTRRTMTLSLLNEDAEFSPTSDWGGLFYVNRLVRLYRGLVVGGAGSTQVEYVPIGTFLIDKTETLVERSMSTVILSGSDLWKKLSKSQFSNPSTHPTGMSINTIIANNIDAAGVTKYVLDPLDGRTSASKNLQAPLAVERGDSRGDFLMTLCSNFGIDIYFDPMGTLRTEDSRNPTQQASVWTLGYSDADTMAYFIRSVTSDDRLYNHVQVVGTAVEDKIFVAELRDTDPKSPTNIDRIGDRMYRMESGVLGSQESVNKAAATLFYSRRLISQDIGLENICMPAFEGNDVITVVEPYYIGVASKFVLTAFNVPLLTGKQQLTVTRVVNLAA